MLSCHIQATEWPPLKLAPHPPCPSHCPPSPTDKKPRAPNPFNVFVSGALRRIRAEQPDIDHKECFRRAVAEVGT
jgi:hypothetical protein